MSWNTTRIVIAWILAVLLGFNFVLSGYPKIFPNDAMIARFANWGYSEIFLIAVGIWEALGGALLLYHRTAFWGALMLVAVMLGAVATHLISGIGSPTFALICLGIALVIALLRFSDAVLLSKRTTSKPVN